MTYEMIVGLEVHAELKTRTKIFCSCRTDYGASPNSQICPVCLGMPGTLPILNRRAVELGIAAGIVTHCAIAPVSRFDRKNYFYPDLPKGYQITQYEEPLCRNGYLEIPCGEEMKRIGITRIHLEEDAGKLLHGEDGTRIDYNRAGVPLIEIVSQPDIRSAEEAKAYLTALRERLVFADVSDCKMNEGSLRCDVNLSVRPVGETTFGTRTEIKNINSIAFVGRAIACEFDRQVKILEEGGVIRPQTRRYDEDNDCTVLMREKESEADYRYLPEPDVPAVAVREDDIACVRDALPVMPDVRRDRYRAWGLSEDYGRILTESRERADYFEQAAACTHHVRVAANLLIGEILPRMGDDPIALPPASLAEIADMAGDKRISNASARRLIPLCEDGRSPAACAESENMMLITDEAAITDMVRRAMDENPEAASQWINGNGKAKQALIGGVMKISRGRAEPSVVSIILNRIAGK